MYGIHITYLTVRSRQFRTVLAFFERYIYFRLWNLGVTVGQFDIVLYVINLLVICYQLFNSDATMFTL